MPLKQNESGSVVSLLGNIFSLSDVASILSTSDFCEWSESYLDLSATSTQSEKTNISLISLIVMLEMLSSLTDEQLHSLKLF